MDKKYGETPQQKIERAFKKVMPALDNLAGESGSAKQSSNEELAFFVNKTFYDALQAAIAKAFIAEFYRVRHLHSRETAVDKIEEIANTAAKNFLDQLCKQENL